MEPNSWTSHYGVTSSKRQDPVKHVVPAVDSFFGFDRPVADRSRLGPRTFQVSCMQVTPGHRVRTMLTLNQWSFRVLTRRICHILSQSYNEPDCRTCTTYRRSQVNLTCSDTQSDPNRLPSARHTPADRMHGKVFANSSEFLGSSAEADTLSPVPE